MASTISFDRQRKILKRLNSIPGIKASHTNNRFGYLKNIHVGLEGEKYSPGNWPVYLYPEDLTGSYDTAVYWADKAVEDVLPLY